MTVTKLPETFRTSDGRKFADKGEADRWEALVTAAREFESSRVQLERALAASFTTADGYPLKLTLLAEYWRVVRRFGNRPYVETVSLPWQEVTVEFGSHRDEVWLKWSRGWGRERVDHQVEIGELYARKENAHAALMPILDAWLAEEAADIERIRSSRSLR